LAIGDTRSARLCHPPTGITIHFDHHKFGGCWRDPCGRRTLAEEKKTDDTLPKLADTAVNAEAA
jgi:hypothetical protein